MYGSTNSEKWRGAISGNWVLQGYQCDIDFANQYTGQIYEERGRGFLAMRGQFSHVPDGGGPKVVGSLRHIEERVARFASTMGVLDAEATESEKAEEERRQREEAELQAP